MTLLDSTSVINPRIAIHGLVLPRSAGNVEHRHSEPFDRAQDRLREESRGMAGKMLRWILRCAQNDVQRLVLPLVSLTLAVLPGCSQLAVRAVQTPEPAVYPSPPASPRIVYLASIDDAGIFRQRSHRMARFLFGRDAEGNQRITKPFGLAAGNDTLLVCDTRQNVVHVFDFKARRCETLGADGRGRLLKPVAVAMDDQGNRYVADPLRKEVVVFSPDNQADRAIGSSGTDPFKPVAVAFHGGRLFVLNAAMHRVEVLDPTTGDVLDFFGEEGNGPGQMLRPAGLAVDSQGRVYVADLLNFRVLVYASDGSTLRTFGEAGDRAGQFSRPKHLSVGPDGIVYVVDAGFQRVQMFDDLGRVLMLFGGPRRMNAGAPEAPDSSDAGALTLPAGICIDRTLLPYFTERMPSGFQADYLLFVSDQFGVRKVNVYAFGRMTETAGG